MDINFDSEDWRTMFSNELALALRDIRAEYDAILESQKGADTDSWYKVRQHPAWRQSGEIVWIVNHSDDAVVMFRPFILELREH